MPESRIEVIDYGEFNPREWLRREVLWASVMTPYSYQMESWLNNTRKAIHDDNLSRKELYDAENDPGLQALSFFNQGKVIAGPLTSAILFRACMEQPNGSASLLEIQAKSVDTLLGRLQKEPSSAESSITDNDAFERCSTYAKIEASGDVGSFIRQHNLLRAAAAMTILATTETRIWIANSFQDERLSLPILNIQDGGSARSAGPRVEMLQPIFRKILASESYQALTAS